MIMKITVAMKIHHWNCIEMGNKYY